MSALISRDPFSRTELHRDQVNTRVGGCAWCGSFNGYGKLFRYRTETDGGCNLEHNGLFCSVGCHDAYHQL